MLTCIGGGRGGPVGLEQESLLAGLLAPLLRSHVTVGMLAPLLRSHVTVGLLAPLLQSHVAVAMNIQ